MSIYLTAIAKSKKETTQDLKAMLENSVPEYQKRKSLRKIGRPLSVTSSRKAEKVLMHIIKTLPSKSIEKSACIIREVCED